MILVKKFIANNMRNIGDEVEFKQGGIIQNRAAEVLELATDLLEKIKQEGLFDNYLFDCLSQKYKMVSYHICFYWKYNRFAFSFFRNI